MLQLRTIQSCRPHLGAPWRIGWGSLHMFRPQLFLSVCSKAPNLPKSPRLWSLSQKDAYTKYSPWPQRQPLLSIAVHHYCRYPHTHTHMENTWYLSWAECVCPLPYNVYVDILTPWCDGIRGWGLWKVIRSWGWGFLDKRDPTGLPQPSCPVRTQREDNHVWTRERALTRHQIGQSLGHRLSVFRMVRILLFKPPGLWQFMITSRTDWLIL